VVRDLGLAASAGLVGVLDLIAQAAPPLPASFLQFGALGLCGYMVWRLHGQQQALFQSHRQEREELLAAVREKDRVLDKRNEELSALCRQNIAAYHRLADLLKDRPCLCEDHRIRSE